MIELEKLKKDADSMLLNEAPSWLKVESFARDVHSLIKEHQIIESKLTDIESQERGFRLNTMGCEILLEFKL